MVGAVIQARMGSTRLPGKVLMEIEGKPLLEHIIDRLKVCNKIKKIVVATTTEKEDNKIQEFCVSKNIDFYRGSTDNVLERFIEASEKFQIDIIVRICADSPLIDPATIDKMIEKLIENNLDLVTINPESTSLLDGFEVTTLKFLKTLKKQATEKYHFEHVTFLAKEKNIGKILYYEPEENLRVKDIRITVDTKEDLEFIREVFKHLYKKNNIIDVRDIEKLPFYIFRINREIKQKAPEEKNFLVNVIIKKEDDIINNFLKTLKKNPSILVNKARNKKEIKKNKELINISLKYIN
ncbi:MAG TPA: glycosyltransferase family protein [Spirochaetota bacterium]|nr:glycosyltransferase family protein [Spirochaetota bacterium]HOM37890.1 glycosyltransferase family protein [Spirochaetota bacterium]HPQ48694.1 glycosyltransferase family protein [Spirochaetota bacterium]